MDKTNLKIDCLACKHYFVTWDKDFPYGCKAMGFKSRNAPLTEVHQSSGMECQRYEKKSAQASHRQR